MFTSLGAVVASAQTAESLQRLRRTPGSKPRNIIFILTDDHRFDALGFMKGQSFLETPFLDSLARDGAHIKNAFVTTALCSPSRASILTGKYAHKHKIVDNNTPIPRGTTFFPQYLQQAGYSTGFFGKWHMGAESDDPATRLQSLGQFPRTGHVPAEAETGSTSTANMFRRKDTSPTNSQIMRSTG